MDADPNIGIGCVMAGVGWAVDDVKEPKGSKAAGGWLLAGGAVKRSPKGAVVTGDVSIDNPPRRSAVAVGPLLLACGAAALPRSNPRRSLLDEAAVVDVGVELGLSPYKMADISWIDPQKTDTPTPQT